VIIVVQDFFADDRMLQGTTEVKIRADYREGVLEDPRRQARPEAASHPDRHRREQRHGQGELRAEVAHNLT
jgi:hypothetical protein